MKSLSMILLCLTMLLAMAACQTAAGEEPGTDSVKFIGVEEHEPYPGVTIEEDLHATLKGTQPYYGIMSGDYLTKKGKIFAFQIYDLNNPTNQPTRIHKKDYVPALHLRAAFSGGFQVGETIYVLNFEGSNNQQELLEFAAEYIDEN